MSSKHQSRSLSTPTLRFLFIGLLLLSQSAMASVSGKWMFYSITGGRQVVESTVVLVDEDSGILSGTFDGQFSSGTLDGSTEADKFEFLYKSSLADLKYIGALEDDGRLRGIVEVNGAEVGTFTGIKVE